MCIASTETKNDTVTTHCNHRCHRVCFTQHPLRFITCPSCGSPLSVSVGITPQQAVSNINGAIGALEVAAKELKEAARKMDKMTRKAEKKKQKQMKKRIFAQEYESEDGP
jgi:hypothetical protein